MRNSTGLVFPGSDMMGERDMLTRPKNGKIPEEGLTLSVVVVQ